MNSYQDSHLSVSFHAYAIGTLEDRILFLWYLTPGSLPGGGARGQYLEHSTHLYSFKQSTLFIKTMIVPSYL